MITTNEHKLVVVDVFYMQVAIALKTWVHMHVSCMNMSVDVVRGWDGN